MCLLPLVEHLLSFPQLEPGDNTNVTVVTAYFSLGTFQKGDKPTYKFSPDTYLQMAQGLIFLQNPLVIFTDCKTMASLFRDHFSGKNLKVVFVSDRSELLSFQLLPKVAQIFSDPNYPKFSPNTVLPEYSCSQHAKMDVVDKALAWNPFRTTYFAWIDIGYFRELVFRKKKFWISVPAEFDDQKVAASLIHTPGFTRSAEEIFKENAVWVGGGMMLATREKYSQFVAEYRRATQYFLAAGLANTDQQVIYAMFQPSTKKELNVSTELQSFSWPLHFLSICWFHLGYHCYREQ
ncbi:hypothetical protein ACOMHN_049754 [Nucella lapillus]